MPIPAIPIVVGVLASAGGLSLGALIRQPEINKLKAQVTALQKELARMQTLSNDVLKDIEILKLKMQLQQNEDILAQLKGKNDIDIGRLIYAYGLKEYLEVKEKYLIKNEDITEGEAVFADSFAMFLDNKVTADENGEIQKRYIKEYLMEKYASEIESLTPPDLMSIISAVETGAREKQKEIDKEQTFVDNDNMGKLECLTLDSEQTRFLYSLELKKIEYDIRASKTDGERAKKTVWQNEWKKMILKSLEKEDHSVEYFIHDGDALYAQMKTAYDKSVQKSWYYLVTFEALLFTPYFSLEDSDKNSVWKNLKLREDYMKEEFCLHQTVIDKAMMERMAATFDKNIAALQGKFAGLTQDIVNASVKTLIMDGLLSVFSPPAALAIAYGAIPTSLSVGAIANIGLSLVGNGALSIGGFGLLGRSTLTGGGAIFGLIGEGVKSLPSITLLSTKGYALRESAKLVTFSKLVLIDEFGMQASVMKIQQAVEKKIKELKRQEIKLRSKSEVDRQAVDTVAKGIKYFERCNTELIKLAQPAD